MKSRSRWNFLFSIFLVLVHMTSDNPSLLDWKLKTHTNIQRSSRTISDPSDLKNHTATLVQTSARRQFQKDSRGLEIVYHNKKEGQVGKSLGNYRDAEPT